MDAHELPHRSAYTRLKASKIHPGGVGVFAIRDIPKDTDIFAGDTSKMIWIAKSEIGDLDPETRKMYDDFCVFVGDKVGCPEDFNQLTPGWFINNPAAGETPSVRCDEKYDFIADRDIKAGEELTVSYDTYSEA